MPILNPTTYPITTREREVVTLASHGKKNREIATALGVSEETIKSHIKNALKKLEASDRTHAVAKCLRAGLID
jgi:DNA-binding NarL/FixJ family response regulator